MWYVTRDMWHMTCDRCGEVNLLSQFLLISSYSLGVKVSWRFWGKGRLNYILINDKGVGITAPATAGLLSTLHWTAFYNTTPYFSTLQCTQLQCTSQIYTALHFTALHFTALKYCTVWRRNIQATLTFPLEKPTHSSWTEKCWASESWT